jgi:hypothetical protein
MFHITTHQKPRNFEVTVWSPAGAGIFLFVTVSEVALGPSLLPNGYRGLFPGEKLQEQQSDHLCPYGIEVDCAELNLYPPSWLNHYQLVRFLVLTAAGEYGDECLLDVAPCTLVKGYWRFRGTCCLHHHRPDDGGSKDLWNVGKLLPDYTVLQPRRQQSLTKLVSFTQVFLSWVNEWMNEWSSFNIF